jgi:hypothetical protein
MTASFDDESYYNKAYWTLQSKFRPPRLRATSVKAHPAHQLIGQNNHFDQ